MIWFCSFHAIECIVYKTGGIVRVVVVRSNYYCDDQYSILRHIEAMVVRTLARTFAVHYGIVLFVLFIIMDIIQIIIIIIFERHYLRQKFNSGTFVAYELNIILC